MSYLLFERHPDLLSLLSLLKVLRHHGRMKIQSVHPLLNRQLNPLFLLPLRAPLRFVTVANCLSLFNIPFQDISPLSQSSRPAPSFAKPTEEDHIGPVVSITTSLRD